MSPTKYIRGMQPPLEVCCPQPCPKLQVLQSKCLFFATGEPWYVGTRKIHEVLVIPFFADSIRVLTESFDSELADAGNILVWQLEGTCADRRLNEVPWGELMFSRTAKAVPRKTAKSAQRAVLRLLSYPNWCFPCSSSAVRQIAG
jgi:hypothetical protein